jgi:hypothetical protein
MNAIELTEAQRQALQAGCGKPVEVVDPATQERYVLLAREQYEQVRPLLQGVAEQPLPPPAPPAFPPTGDGEPPRVRLRDLPMPPLVVEEVKRLCKQYGWPRKAAEEQCLLSYYFGGQSIYVLSTPKGTVVVPITEKYKDTADLPYVMLTAEERLHACLTSPSRWDDTDTILG